MGEPLGLPQGAFSKIDGGEDELFYEPSRLVHHIDEHAVAALTEFYRQVLPPGGVLSLLARAAARSAGMRRSRWRSPQRARTSHPLPE